MNSATPSFGVLVVLLLGCYLLWLAVAPRLERLAIKYPHLAVGNGTLAVILVFILAHYARRAAMKQHKHTPHHSPTGSHRKR